MGITFGFGRRRSRSGGLATTRGARPDGSPARSRASDVEVITAAARLVVSTRFATSVLLERRLQLTAAEAQRILARLEHCRVIAPSVGGRPHSVLTTSQQLPGVIDEFAARG